MKHEMYCYNCRFYCRADYEGPMDALEHLPQGTTIAAEGECRRYPPCHGKTVMVDNAERTLLGDWPLVEDQFWCGQFERRTVSKCDNGCPFKPFCTPKIKELCITQRPENN